MASSDFVLREIIKNFDPTTLRQAGRFAKYHCIEKGQEEHVAEEFCDVCYQAVKDMEWLIVELQKYKLFKTCANCKLFRTCLEYTEPVCKHWIGE